MADKENSAPIHHAAASNKCSAASKKRSAAAPCRQSKRKRVPLGELPTNISTAAGSSPPKRVTRSRTRKEAAQNAPQPPAATAAVLDAGEDPQLCAPYATNIYCYLRSMEMEPKRWPLASFIEDKQTDITPSMRSILVDWLVEVAEEYKLVSDTLYLTISYIDRFLSSNNLSRQKLQLLGVSCMLIAAKYEEINPPHVEDFCYITDNTYNKQEVVNMESSILKFLNFEMGNPTIKTFLRRFTRSGKEDGNNLDLQLQFLGNYLAELSLLDYGCVQFLPSLVAASAVFVSKFTINPDIHPWSRSLQLQTCYSPSVLKDCIHAIHDLQLNRKGSSFTSIREKYKQHRFGGVSMLLPPTEIPASYLEDCKQ